MTNSEKEWEMLSGVLSALLEMLLKIGFVLGILYGLGILGAAMTGAGIAAAFWAVSWLVVKAIWLYRSRRGYYDEQRDDSF